MTSLLGYLGMDVAAMTANDWLGVFFSVLVFVGMVYAYFMVFRPANKEKFESQRGMALDDDDPVKMGEKR
ncbi:MAG: cbb3-type cytochrome c oxidase subunit 3 [Gallionellaceae bacterium]|nr:cbb3-type cytochrome c oxidase subunit 3 [Gallionellaceae bacterium]